MNELIFEVATQGNRLMMNQPHRLASGSTNAVKIQFNFSADFLTWEGYGKTAVFYRKEDQVYHVPLTNDGALVPHEVLADDGYFFFGLMGVKGDTVRTTEVLRVTVVKGAIATATAEPEDPTPDIYQQLVELYGLTESRLNQLEAMRGAYGEAVHPLDGEYIAEGSVKVNGCAAALSFLIDGLTLGAWSTHILDGNIPPEIMPLFPKDTSNNVGSIPLYTTHKDLEVVLKPPANEGDWAYIQIFNMSDQYVEVYGAHCYGFYNLASPYIIELADARVGADGTIYPTAGDAIRGQFDRLDKARLSDEAKQLLLQILQNGVYKSDQSANLAAFETALRAGDENDYQLFCGISEHEIKTGSSTYNGAPYYIANSVRSCYVGDKILLDYGYAYKFEIKTRAEGLTEADFRIGIQAHNSGALELFRNGKPCWTDYSESGGTVDIGWQENGFEFTCPETITDTKLNTNSAMNPGFAHLAFKRQSDSAMVAGDISRVLVYRKKVV